MAIQNGSERKFPVREISVGYKNIFSNYRQVDQRKALEDDSGAFSRPVFATGFGFGNRFGNRQNKIVDLRS